MFQLTRDTLFDDIHGLATDFTHALTVGFQTFGQTLGGGFACFHGYAGKRDAYQTSLFDRGVEIHGKLHRLGHVLGESRIETSGLGQGGRSNHNLCHRFDGGTGTIGFDVDFVKHFGCWFGASNFFERCRKRVHDFGELFLEFVEIGQVLRLLFIFFVVIMMIIFVPIIIRHGSGSRFSSFFLLARHFFLLFLLSLFHGFFV
mmetsp:Transcript_5127/g.10851  ORF Transcript_5127/g.10851 Transcript_5127/m.10851 type:complete len:202 (+) Transcript_5127:135-740(+)